MRTRFLLLLAIGGFCAFIATSTASAQLTWDPAVSGGTSPGGTGTWDTTTGNWWDGSSDTTWDNTGATTANFTTASATEVVSIGSGLTVGDLTKTTGQILQFDGSGGDQAITIKSGGATWTSTGGNAFQFLTSGNDAGLSVSSGDTLTINSDSGFQAIGAPTTAWAVSGATLDYTGTDGQIRGSNTTIGQFGTVKIAAGTTRFLADVNNTTLANDWVLDGTGQVAFDAQAAYNYTLSGDISGTAGMRTEFMGKKIVYIRGDNSTWSGGLEIGNASKASINNVNQLGTGNVTLSGNDLANAGVLLLGGVNMGSSRELHVNGFGGSIVNQGANAFGGKITGSGILHIGHANHDGNTNTLTVSGTNSDHTGITRVWRGTLALGADDALSHATVLQLGGEGSSLFQMNGFDAEIAGLTSTASNTRRVDNNGATVSTLTINVADAANYTYGSAFAVTGPGINVVKNGLGTQKITNGEAKAVDLTVNAGELVWAGNDPTGAVTVSANSTLQSGNGGGTGGIATADIANDGAVVFNRSNAIAYSGVISGEGGVTYSAGSNAVTLSAVQTYKGNTTIDRAVLTAQSANALSADSAVLIGGAGSGHTSAFEMNGFAQEIGGLAIVTGSHTRTLQNNGADATLTLNVGTAESYAYNANVAGSGTIDIVKTGDGTQTFNRSGGYTTAFGDVTVSAGELIWNNNTGSTVSGTVAVGANGTLSGAGVLGGAVTVDGKLNPGNSPGTLTFDEALTLGSTATTTLELTGTGAGFFDVLLNDGGDVLTAGGILALDTTGYVAMNGDSFLVFENWSSFSGSFASITGTDLGGGLSFDTSDLLTGGTLTVTAVPEPSTAMLLVLGFGAVAVRRRRR
ncbi:PEP-CTERM motif protein [Planctomycetes bacterium CA13]|uniref:PEP-CTERM motif protein n=1 Tax=Novipirellula herctigrandis TaxID=2527986 RepID=A0A5C5YYR4_9BACT|nr:PEP-CTERM motif protein [Planctomycetes bacterium CA13]